MYGCESWTIKKAGCWRTDAFELWCWRRLLRVPWTARRSNQLILKEISPEYSLEGLMLKRKLQHFGHLMWRTDSSEENLMLGKIGGRKRRGRQRMRCLDGITNSRDMNLSKLREIVKGSHVCYSSWGCRESDMTWWLNNNNKTLINFAIITDWRSWSWMVLWRPTRAFRTDTQKRCPFHDRGLECKSRKSRNTRANLALEYRMRQGKG